MQAPENMKNYENQVATTQAKLLLTYCYKHVMTSQNVILIVNKDSPQRNSSTLDKAKCSHALG